MAVKFLWILLGILSNVLLCETTSKKPCIVSEDSNYVFKEQITTVAVYITSQKVAKLNFVGTKGRFLDDDYIIIANHKATLYTDQDEEFSDIKYERSIPEGWNLLKVESFHRTLSVSFMKGSGSFLVFKKQMKDYSFLKYFSLENSVYSECDSLKLIWRFNGLEKKTIWLDPFISQQRLFIEGQNPLIKIIANGMKPIETNSTITIIRNLNKYTFYPMTKRTTNNDMDLTQIQLENMRNLNCEMELIMIYDEYEKFDFCTESKDELFDATNALFQQRLEIFENVIKGQNIKIIIYVAIIVILCVIIIICLLKFSIKGKRNMKFKNRVIITNRENVRDDSIIEDVGQRFVSIEKSQTELSDSNKQDEDIQLYPKTML
ncbi:hypothetical protein CsNV_025 [Callinectes sapidus nudivirus]|nr:hypothetical protein CsNV_025 [Callinectes sapidus nudivirus]